MTVNEVRARLVWSALWNSMIAALGGRRPVWLRRLLEEGLLDRLGVRHDIVGLLDGGWRLIGRNEARLISRATD